MRATTPPGWNRRPSDWPRKPRKERQGSCAERELEWIRCSPKARQAKSKARIKSYEDLRDAAERAEITTAQITIPPGPRLGGVVVEVEDLKKGFEDKLLIDGLTFKLPPGGIVGVIGPNGAGKIHPVQDDDRAGKARRRHGPSRRYGASWAMSISRATRSIRTRPSGRKSPAAMT